MNAAPAFNIPNIDAIKLLFLFKTIITLSSTPTPSLINAFAILFAFVFSWLNVYVPSLAYNAMSSLFSLTQFSNILLILYSGIGSISMSSLDIQSFSTIEMLFNGVFSLYVMNLFNTILKLSTKVFIKSSEYNSLLY